MTSKLHCNSVRARGGVTRRTFAAGIGAAGMLAGSSPFAIGRAQGAALKVGVLLPRSGVQAGIGQDCQRGVEIASGILKDLGLPNLAIMNGDTESNVEVSRARAERLIGEGCAAPRWRLRLRPDHGNRPGGRAEGHPLRDQHRRRPADHRAGLQVRVPQFPDRADDPGRCLRQPEGDLGDHRLAAEIRRLHACQRHVRHVHAEGHRRRHAQVQHALHDRRDDRLRSGGARSVGRGGQGQGDGRARRCWSPAGSTTPCCSPASWSSSAGRRWACSAWGRAGTRTSI